jgi:hypothetical protein
MLENVGIMRNPQAKTETQVVYGAFSARGGGAWGDGLSGYGWGHGSKLLVARVDGNYIAFPFTTTA